MKKLLVFVLLIILLFGFNVVRFSTLSEMLINYSDEFIIVSNRCLNGVDSCVKNGETYINKLNKNSIKNVIKNNVSIFSESVVLFDVDMREIIRKLDLKIVEINNVNNGIELLGFTNKLRNNYVVCNMKKVNIQIVCDNNKVTVGHPLILSGF